MSKDKEKYCGTPNLIIYDNMEQIIKKVRKEVLEEIRKEISVKFDWDRYELKRLLDELEDRKNERRLFK